MEQRLRLLLISKRLPVADADHAGGQITYFYLQAAVHWAEVDVVALAAQGENVTRPAGVRSLEVVSCPLGGTDASSAKGMVIRARGYSQLLLRSLRLANSRTYDLVLLERSAIGWMGPILRRRTNNRIVLVSHDLWFDRLESEAKKARGARSLYFSALATLARQVERWGAVSADGIISYDTRTDNLIRERLLPEKAPQPPMTVLPAYHRVWSSGAVVPTTAGSICFYGNMGRSANWRSAVWFLTEVFPRIRREIPHATFHAVGASPPDALCRFHDGEAVTVTGYVENPDSILAAADVFVAPLVAGTGIKIKVLEAMASRVPLVANTIAMQGIPAVDERDYLHAEDADGFAHQVLRLLSDRELRDRIAAGGFRLRNDFLDPESGDRRYREFLKSVAGRVS